MLAPLRLTSGGQAGPQPKLTLPASDRHLSEPGGPAVEIAVGWGPLPTCVTARLEAAGQMLAYGGFEGPDCIDDLRMNPFQLSMTSAGLHLFARGKPVSGELIVEGYSATGLLSIVRTHTTIAGRAPKT